MIEGSPSHICTVLLNLQQLPVEIASPGTSMPYKLLKLAQLRLDTLPPRAKQSATLFLLPLPAPSGAPNRVCRVGVRILFLASIRMDFCRQ